MLTNLKEIYRPKNLSEAKRILKKGKGKIIPLAGSTTIGMMSNPSIEGLLDIEPLKLNYVKSSGGKLTLGAGTTISELLGSKAVQKFCGGLLHQCGTTIGKITNRNMITVGGNIVQVHPWSALPVALLALDASIVVERAKKRIIPASEFFAKAPKILLSYDGLVTEVQVPSEFANASGRYLKFSVTKNDYPLVSIAVVLKKKGAKVELLRIVCGALTLLPQRLYKVEEFVSGKELSDDTIEKASELAAESVNIGNDFRASKEYKKTIVRNFISEILRELKL